MGRSFDSEVNPMLNNGSYTFEPIATIHSCYPERFGIPRQAGLVPSAIAQIEFPHTEDNRLALRGIENFSHLWVLFVFHRQNYKNWKPLVNPPRLGGKTSVGVYATRSPNRFNPIGMSVVEFDHLEFTDQILSLHIRGGDFLDGTPVLDIKPYVTYSDAITTAQSAWATPPQTWLPVQWSDGLLAEMEINGVQPSPQEKQLIEETIALDPRPGYERNKDGKPGQQWHMAIAHYEISWKVEQGIAMITHCQNRTEGLANPSVQT